MQLDLDDLKAKEVYSWMIQTIIPRPIAWVLSDNGNESFNLAPFSYFNGITSKPPLLSISIGKKADRSKKDTWVNLEERKEFVLHIPKITSAEAVMESAEMLPHGVSEVEKSKLELIYEEGFRLPRLASADVAYFCELDQIIEIGDVPQGLVIGRIRSIYVSDSILTADGKVDYQKMQPLGRLGGNDFAELKGAFTV